MFVHVFLHIYVRTAYVYRCLNTKNVDRHGQTFGINELYLDSIHGQTWTDVDENLARSAKVYRRASMYSSRDYGAFWSLTRGRHRRNASPFARGGHYREGIVLRQCYSVLVIGAHGFSVGHSWEGDHPAMAILQTSAAGSRLRSDDISRQGVRSGASDVNATTSLRM